MNYRNLYIIFILFAGLVLSACEKSDDASEGIAKISQIKVLGESNVVEANTAVAGDGVYLLVYTNVEFEYFAKLMTNEGVELWTKNLTVELGFNAYIPPLNAQALQTSGSILTIEEVLYDIDGTFAFFSGQRLVKMDIHGDVVYDNPQFVTAYSSSSIGISILNVFITNDGDYFVSGRLNQGLNSHRGYYTKYSRTGNIEFTASYFIDTSGNMGITGAIEQDGFFMLGGYYSVISGMGNNKYYMLKVSAEGELIWAQNHNTASTDFFFAFSYAPTLGRELILLNNGNMMYIMVPAHEFMPDQRSKGFIIDEKGAVVDSVFFDLANSNVASGANQAIGKGIVQLNDDSYIGIVNPISSVEGAVLENEIIVPLNYQFPKYGYIYSLDAFGGIDNMKYINRSLSNTLSAITLLSNGRTVILGVQASINNELRLILITNE